MDIDDNKNMKRMFGIRLGKRVSVFETSLAAITFSIVAVIVFIAINPLDQMAKARDSQRYYDITAILNAIYQYSIENEGKLPAKITDEPTPICKGDANCKDLVDLSLLLSENQYLVAIPFDPNETSENKTGYEILQKGNYRIEVSAPMAETASISVFR